MADIPGTPRSIGDLTATALRRIAYEKKLNEDSIRPSIFTALKTETSYDGHTNEISIEKSGIMMDVSNVGRNQGQSVVVGLVKNLRKKPRYGTSQHSLGYEEDLELLWTQLYYNEIKKSVKYYKWGYFKNDTEYLGYMKKYGPAITKFMAENRDTRIEQALLLTVADELIEAPVNLAQQFNKNWIIPNLAESDNPAWDNTALTVADGVVDADEYYSDRTFSGATSFVENIVAAMMAASGTGATSKALLNVDTLVQICTYIKDQMIIDPIMMDGMPTVILTIPTKVKGWMMNPNKSGSLAAYWKEVAYYKDDNRMKLPGEFGRLFDYFVCVENWRAPTLTVGGSVGSYTLKPGFINPGNNDDRNNTAWSNTSGSVNYVFDVVMALGLNALAQFTHDPQQSDMYEHTEYGKIEGRNTYLGQGIQIPTFDLDAASRLDGSSTTQIQKGSAVIPVSRIPVATIN